MWHKKYMDWLGYDIFIPVVQDMPKQTNEMWYFQVKFSSVWSTGTLDIVCVPACKKGAVNIAYFF